MKPTLIAHFKNKNVVLSIVGEQRHFLGKIIALEDGSIVLSSNKFGITNVDCKYIISIREDLKNKERECPELETKERQQ